MQAYEPMTLGSPSSNHQSPFSPHSPSIPPHPSSPNSKPRFQDNTPRQLPSYLMGDYQKRHRPFMPQSPSNPSTTPTQPTIYSPNHYPPSPYERPRAKEHKGPPLQSLQEAFNNNRNNNSLNNSNLFDSPYNNNNNTFPQQHTTPHNYNVNKTDPFMSPITMTNNKDPIFNHHHNNPSSPSSPPLNHAWVTVFGFPNDATSCILQEFSELGCVIKHIIPEKGNWVHLLYENKIQAKRALSRNGRVMGDSVMVGVLPCSDQTLTRHTDTHAHTYNNQRNNLDLSNAPALDRALNGEPREKKAGLISKTLDYVMGW